MHSTVVLIRPRGRHALTLPRCTALPSVFSIPSPIEGHAIPPLRCKLLSAFYTSRNRIWVNSAKIEIPPSPLSSSPSAGRSGSRSRPPSRQPSQRVTLRPPKSRRKGTSAAPTEIKMPACLCIPGSPPSSPSFCRRRRHVNERECAPGFSISRHVHRVRASAATAVEEKLKAAAGVEIPVA